MRTSQRPDGVPAAVQTDEVAVGIAFAIWTFDGQPWDRMLVGGSCAATCVVEVAGSRDGIEGEDLWTFAVDPAADRVAVTTTSLRALPDALVAQLDGIARAAASQPLDELQLTTAAWVPPPDTEAFVLSYRSGGEEGSCSAEMIVGADGTLIDETYTGC